MKVTDNKLFSFVKSFSEKELYNFKKFIASPIYTGGRNYLPFLAEIIKINKKTDPHYSSQELYSKLYPGKKFNEQTLKNRFSEMFKLCEEFIVYNKINSDSFEKEKFLLEYYLEKKLYRLFDNKYKKTSKNLQDLPDNEIKFKNTAFLNMINITLLNKKNLKVKMYDQFYKSASYNICTYLIEIFQFGIEYKIQEYDNIIRDFNIVTIILDNLELEEIIHNFIDSDEEIHKVVCMFYFLYKAFENIELEVNYYESRKLFSKLLNFLGDEYKNDIYKSMISYCIMRQNSGVKKFQVELFEIYNEKLSQGLYSEFRAKMYPVNTFREYVFIGLELSEFDWVLDFIKKYSKELPEEIKNDEVNLSYAKFYYKERQFNKALDNINLVKGNNYVHYIDSSILKLIIYFESDKIEESYLEVDKLRHYLRNHKEIPKVHRDPLINFVKLYQKIIKKKNNSDEDDLGFLKNEILSAKYVAKREWLIEKLSE